MLLLVFRTHLNPHCVPGRFLYKLPLPPFPEVLGLLVPPSGQLLVELALRRLFFGLERAKFCGLFVLHGVERYVWLHQNA